MEVLALERTLTELDHVRLKNLVHRDRRDGSLSSRARWRTPTGEEKAAEILAILFQPEASGDYSM